MENITIGQRVFLALCKGGSSGMAGTVTGLSKRYGMRYVVIEKNGKRYSAPVDNAQEG